jgi:predicted transcriptional regulator
MPTKNRGKNVAKNKRLTARRILAAERREKAVRLVVEERKTMAEVGRILGISKVAVWKMIHGYVDQINARNVEQTKELRQEQLNRIERLVFVYAGKALDGDEKAGALLVRILERQAKLAGLDAAIILEHQGAGGGPVNFVVDARERLLGMIKALEPPKEPNGNGGTPTG